MYWWDRLLDDRFYHSALWSPEIVRKMTQKHLRNRDIFAMALFFLANGLQPRYVKEVFRRLQVTPKQWQDLLGIIRKYRRGDLRGRIYWDCHRYRVPGDTRHDFI